MNREPFIRADVLDARRQGLIKCPCDATYSKSLKKCPKCDRPNPEKVGK